MNDNRTVLQLGTHTPHTLSSTLTHMYLHIHTLKVTHFHTHLTNTLIFIHTQTRSHKEFIFAVDEVGL